MLQDILDRCFVGPILPASIGVLLLAGYVLLALIGLVGLDAGLDLDVDADVDVAGDLDVGGDFDPTGGIGAATLRWLNLGRVPIVIWGGIFVAVFWIVSYGLWHHFDVRRRPDATMLAITWLTVRNAGLATIITKAVTEPMTTLFINPPEYDPARLVGQSCQIASVTADEKFGHAKLRTDRSPLLLNVRTSPGRTLNKGDEAKIVSYDPVDKIHRVEPLDESIPRESLHV